MRGGANLLRFLLAESNASSMEKHVDLYFVSQCDHLSRVFATSWQPGCGIGRGLHNKFDELFKIGQSLESQYPKPIQCGWSIL